MIDSLWNRIQEDDIAAFDEFYHKHVSSLYNYSRRITNNEALIEECIQSLFVQLYKKRKSIQITSSPKAYLFTWLRRNLVKELKEKNKKVELDFNAGLEFVDPHETKIIEDDARQELVNKLNLAKSSLTKRQKEAIYLKFYEGMAYDELCLAMNLTKEACYKIVNQAIKRLSENF